MNSFIENSQEVFLGVNNKKELSNINENVVTDINNEVFIICPICSVENPADAKFCKECGQKLTVPNKSITQNSFLENAVSDLLGRLNNEAEETPTPAVPDIVVKAADMPDEKPIETGIQAVTANVAENTANENILTLTCPFCGTANENEARFCGECGRELANSDKSLAQNSFLENVVGDLLGGSNNEAEEIADQAVSDIKVKVVDMPDEKPIETEMQVKTANATDNTTVQYSFLENTVSDLLGVSFK